MQSALFFVGVDEAGRGPLAGPVVAAAVLLPTGGIAGLADSKTLSAKRRVALEIAIKRTARWAIATASVAEIDRLNILQASLLAMARAVTRLELQGGDPSTRLGALEILAEEEKSYGLPNLHELSNLNDSAILRESTPAPPPHFGDAAVEILVDGVHVPRWPYRARAVIKGDVHHSCISAASILAKQARDRIMVAADICYPGYGWSRNKGYGTVAHIAALQDLGVTPLHRYSFAPVRSAAAAQNQENQAV